MPGFRRETLVAIDAMTSALTIARHGIKAEDITSKSGRDVVTVADLAVEDAVRATLVDAVGFSVVGEEPGGEIVDRLLQELREQTKLPIEVIETEDVARIVE